MNFDDNKNVKVYDYEKIL